MIVNINGVTHEVPDGSNISVVNGQVNISNSGSIGSFTGGTIIVQGDTGDIRADKASVQVKGSVRGDVNAGSSVSCGNVGKSVTAGSSVTCDDVGGNVSAGSSVNCDDIRGSCSAGSSIRRG